MNEQQNEPRPGPPMGEEEIGDLIRAAGRRSAIPEEDLTAIKEAAGSAWRETVEAERRSRFRRRAIYAVAATVLVAVVGTWWWMADRVPVVPARIATVELATGRIDAARAAGEILEIGVGDSLSSGDSLATAGSGLGSPGRVALRMAWGHSVRLDAGTRVRLVSGSRLELQRGAVYVDSGPSVAADAAIEILTPLGVVREIGTQYEVRLADETGTVRVRVREGSVSVALDGESHSAGRGEQLTLGPDGSVSRAAVDPDGPDWHWVLAAAPSLDIEGLSLGEFIDWVARETGWQVRYADEELERSARAILLHGTIEGLRPDESIGMVLQGSGLDHRDENGTILVVRP